ncbi:MAG: rRNA maturation RNase YbeY [Gammaproteobacteria bacterium]|nr:MAG: rRNA maturation RNase YbeY [Gammaproteobacteria bacterium]RKZ75250.1 MAG: rRNA maturation RNase YbeY [Gammaproteobacteria bacterium]
MNINIEVDVQYASAEANLPNKKTLSHWINVAFSCIPLEQTGDLPCKILPQRQVEMTIRLVDETEGTQLNETWRGGVGPTNVLSFPFECPPGVDMPLLGDIIICAPLVAREATKQNKSLSAHWTHLVIHGTLHLLGYDHIEESQAQLMENLEIRILHDLGYSNPYHIIEPL